MGHGILPISLEAIAGAIFLPEDYKLVSAHYDEFNRIVNLVVESEKVEETPAGQQLPRIHLLCAVAQWPTDPEYRKITSNIEVTR
jgi:hypothetical protein